MVLGQFKFCKVEFLQITLFESPFTFLAKNFRDASSFFLFCRSAAINKIFIPFSTKSYALFSGRFRWGPTLSSPQGFDLLAIQRVPPLLLIRGKQFRRPARKVFYRRLWRQCILILKKRSRQKDYFFLSNCFQKLLRNSNFDMFFFFKNMPAAWKVCRHKVFLSVLGALGKSIWSI